MFWIPHNPNCSHPPREDAEPPSWLWIGVFAGVMLAVVVLAFC